MSLLHLSCLTQRGRRHWYSYLTKVKRWVKDVAKNNGWPVLRVIATVYAVVMSPVYVGFEMDGWLGLWVTPTDILCEIFFLAEVYWDLLRGVYDQDSSRQVRRHCTVPTYVCTHVLYRTNGFKGLP